jgi:hypothetical protein
MVWPDSMPPEIAQEVEREAERASRSAGLEPAKAPPNEHVAKRPRKPRPLRTVEPAPDVERDEIGAIAETDPRDLKPGLPPKAFKPGLRLIPGQASEAAPSALSSNRRVRRAPHLRLVKP